MTNDSDCESDPSDSRAQRDVEVKMLEMAKQAHWSKERWEDVAARFNLPSAWKRAKPDGVWLTANGALVLAECYARIDKLKPGHRRKIAFDVLKLSTLRELLGGYPKVRCLLVVPEQISAEFNDGSWLAAAIRASAEVVFVTLLQEDCSALKAATYRQAEGQARQKK